MSQVDLNSEPTADELEALADKFHRMAAAIESANPLAFTAQVKRENRMMVMALRATAELKRLGEGVVVS